ncbi:MAG TPA: type II toxin-antitoxin system RelE/ParE family toxin [Longimicrobiaceae bacterium]|nr:type II toxin-antitoxin system RelE/ParE family toxin [Longimicrobiaceae bacterium]
MKLVWTALAREQLRVEAAYIARSRPLAARQWLLGLREAVDRLRQYPFSGRPVPELPNTPRREIVHGAYRVIYEARSTGVFILSVRHSRQLVSEDEPATDDE